MQTQRGFTLIEMIGALVVVAILALALVPVLIRQLDQVAAEKEAKELKALADGFRQGVLKTKTIPNESGWYSLIATNVGLQIGQVRTNARRNERVFLIDPDLEIGFNGGKLPYSQTAAGSQVNGGSGLIAPINIRLVILSSISAALPGSLVSGVASTSSAFSNIWNVPEGTVPAGWSWNGQGEDLKVQRIHLADAFVPLILNNTMTNRQGRYAIEGSSLVTLPVAPSYIVASTFTAYFLDGSHLALYDQNNVLQYGEILHEARSFDFALDTWRGGQEVVPEIRHPGPLDLQMVANAFLASSINPSAKNGATPSNVYSAMITYMQNYVAWADGCAFPGSLLTPLQSAQTVLDNRSKDLIQKQ
jgi:prepilin-type N-terminal cleavage/methylation domain-containing protein